MRCNFKYLFLLLLLGSCQKQENTLFSFLDSNHSNVEFNNILTNTEELNILNYLYFYNGAGVASGDFDNDGYIDLYFTANRGEDKLYLNQGNLKFEDVTTKAKIINTTGFTTGVTIVDINNDGWLDIYVCKVSGLDDFDTPNLLYVNQGIDNGSITFKEEANAYNLDISSYATQASFFDYDVDGDLDLFLLNHSIKPNRSYGKGNKRNEIDSIYGDKLYENINSKFIDVSKSAKIFQGGIGYGLGVSIADINNDGYPDIYVGNDFFENDYLYLNQGDKTFSEVISSEQKSLGHTTHFSMGNAIGDIDNDGLQDILSVDMLPEDLYTLKTSAPEYNYPINKNYLKQGYAPQYMQNTLHLNRGNNTFSEIAHLAGIEATEWSWSPVLADFDNDGFKDIYITNGILGATNDMDFINFISDEAIQKAIDNGVRKDEMKLIEKIPSKKTTNYFFKNTGNLGFTNRKGSWHNPSKTYSNGAVAADLDNDGDLDLVINNVNDTAQILVNNSEKTKEPKNYLKITFEGSENNLFGMGAKVILYTGNTKQLAENYTTKGYLSASSPQVHFGIGTHHNIDSLKVIWPDRKKQVLTKISANQTLILKHKDARELDSVKIISKNTRTPSPYIDFVHKENATLDFYRDALIPYSSSSLGPALAVADINNDGLDDIFIGGAKAQASSLYLQREPALFTTSQDTLFNKVKLNEDISAIFEDLNGDAYPELIIASSGNEFKTGKPIQPRLYWNKKGVFELDSAAFANTYINASKIKVIDIDQDLMKDIVIISNTTPEAFGLTPKQYIFKNNGNDNFENVTLTIAPEFSNLGNLSDIVFGDFNKNGAPDFITLGHWLPLTFFEWENGAYAKKEIYGFENTNGWWNTLKAEDFDNDGDLDIVAGNWGENTRLRTSVKEPITLYSYDFDNNGNANPLVTYFYQGKETTFASKEELDKQMPFIKKKYLTHNDFARASVDEIFGRQQLNLANKKKVYTLATTYFENLGDNSFKPHKLPKMAQISYISNIVVEDFNSDGYFDILLTGNHYEISTQLSSLDASHGEVFLNNKKGGFYYHPTPKLNISGVVRNTESIRINDEKYIVVGRNNDKPLFVPLRLIKN